MQKTLAKQLGMGGGMDGGGGEGGGGGLLEEGSMYMCSRGEEGIFWNEFQLLRRLMMPEVEEGRENGREERIRWCEEEEVVAMHGSQAGT